MNLADALKTNFAAASEAKFQADVAAGRPPTPIVRYVNIEGPEDTFELVRKEIRDAAGTFTVMKAAREIVADIPEREKLAEIIRIGQWSQAHVKYTNDPWGIETVNSPVWLLHHGHLGWDCDDHTALNGALLKSLGIRVRPIMGGNEKFGGWFRKSKIGYVHIWLQAFDPKSGTWVDVDSTNKQQPIGWRYPYRFHHFKEA
ncbi:MAG: transglutaminase family protein [bacterium]|nr:transglutaminase family protein [bacterium]